MPAKKSTIADLLESLKPTASQRDNMTSLRRRWQKYSGQQLEIQDLTYDSTELFAEWLASAGFGSRTLKNFSQALNLVWQEAEKRGLAEASPSTSLYLRVQARVAINTTEPTEWHRRPKRTNGRCPICDCPAMYAASSHRATLPDENAGCKWLRDVRGRVEQLGKERARPGPGKETVDKIAKATAAIATGETYANAAKAAGVASRSMREWREKYPELWAAALDKAMKRMVEIVRAQAGTDEVFADPESFLRKASEVAKWTKQQETPLFAGDGRPTVRSFYDNYYKPNCLDSASEKTLAGYEGIVRQWELLAGDPPLEEISTTVLSKFRDAIAKMRGRKPGTRKSANTVRSVLRHLQAIIDKAGPPARRNRDAAGLIDQTPYCKPPREVKRVPRIASIDAINATYLASVAANAPFDFGYKPPQWWKALLVTAFNTGLRRGSLLSLRISDIDWKNHFVTLDADRMKTAIGNQLPLNEVTMRHLLAIRTERELVFPWPHDLTHLRTCFYRIQEAAGLPESERFTFQMMRRTAGSLLWQQDPAAAQLLLGHTTMKTTQAFYVNGRNTIARAFAEIQQPTAFTGLAASPDLPTSPASIETSNLARTVALLSEGDYTSACLRGRVELEGTLGRMCKQRKIPVSRKGLAPKVHALRKCGLLNESQYRESRRLSQLANKVAHGGKADEAKTRDFVKRLVALLQTIETHDASQSPDSRDDQRSNRQADSASSTASDRVPKRRTPVNGRRRKASRNLESTAGA